MFQNELIRLVEHEIVDAFLGVSRISQCLLNQLRHLRGREVEDGVAVHSDVLEASKISVAQVTDFDGLRRRPRSIHLPGYNSAVAAGVATIMPSFSKWVDGVAMHLNSTLMLGWLKSSAAGTPPGPNFQGFLVGDWDAHSMPASFDAGLDVPMASGGGIGYANTINSNYTGTHVARFDDAVKRVLRLKAWMGMLDPNGKYLTDRRLTALVGCAEHRDVARACVRASLVLLKNANATLPMPKTANVAIWGNGGDDVGIQCGGWTVSWQGQNGSIPGGGGTSIRTGMQAVGTGGTVSYVASPAAVGTSDYIVAVLSEDGYAETTIPNINLTGNTNPNSGNRPLSTASNQAVITQIAAAHTAGKKVVCVLIAGRPLDITSVIDNCDAFVWASLPGSEGRGVAEMLYGDQGDKFTGKLPFTWPTNLAQEPINSGDGKTENAAHAGALLIRVVFVDEDVVPALERPAVEVFESAVHRVELCHVDAHHVQGEIDRVNDDAHGQDDVRLFFDFRSPSLVDRSATEADHRCRSGPADDHVGADAARAILGILGEPLAHTDKAQNEGHGNADQQNTQEATHRLVLEVFQDELGSHVFGPWG